MQTKVQTPLSANSEKPALSQFLVPGRATQRGGNTGAEGTAAGDTQLQAAEPERNVNFF